MRDYPHLQKIIRSACVLGPARVAIVYPCSAIAIDAAVTAQRIGLIVPTMVGPIARIREIAKENRLDVSGMEFVETGDDPVAAARATLGLCRDAENSLHTDELMGVMVSKDSGLRTARRISHAFVFDMPNFSKPLLMADCVVNINPSLMEKRDIIQNAIDLAHVLGIAVPYVAILSAVETINPAIPGTIDAAALSKMSQRGQITGAVVDGPLSFDVAISAEAASIKGLVMQSQSQPDILIMPNLEAGNILYKQLIHLADGECAGVILGTKVPIVLTSRADSPMSRIASCALATLYTKSRSQHL
jgi:phosphate acetyltransferase